MEANELKGLTSQLGQLSARRAQIKESIEKNVQELGQVDRVLQALEGGLKEALRALGVNGMAPQAKQKVIVQLKASQGPLNKTCNRCSESKPRSEFNNWIGSRDGLYVACRVCQHLEAKRDQYVPVVDRVRNAHKWCYHCKKWRALKYFGMSRKSPDGKQSWCKGCYHRWEMTRRKGRN